MMLTTATPQATDPQLKLIRDLAAERVHEGLLNGEILTTVRDALSSVDAPGAKFISLRAAREAITVLKLLPRRAARSGSLEARTTSAGIRPTSSQVDRAVLAALLVRLPLSRYALPRRADGVWDFFEVVERRNGTRYLNRLIGSPGDWRREHLPMHLQIAAARSVLIDPRSSAVQYAQQHGRCAVCNSHLSDPASIARSMGPICAKRF